MRVLPAALVALSVLLGLVPAGSGGFCGSGAWTGLPEGAPPTGGDLAPATGRALTEEGKPERGGLPRSEPAISGEGAHARSATWELLSSSSYASYRVEVHDGRANLSRAFESSGDHWSRLADLGSGAEREDFSAAWDDTNHQMIVHGGYYYEVGMQDASWFQPLYTYSPATNTWTSRGNARLPAGNIGVWDPADGLFITHGGYYLHWQGNAYYRQTWGWDPSTSSWTQLADGPTRFHHSAVWDPIDGVMLVFGGQDTSGGTPYGDLWAFSPGSNNWTRLSVSGASPGTRAYHTAVWDSLHGQMLLFGGYSSGALADLWAFNYTQLRWTQKASAQAGRYGHAACWNADEGVMTVVGGKVGAQGTNSNETLTYDPSSDTWTSSAGLPASGRFQLAGAYDPGNRQMILCGGGTGAGQDEFTETWSFKYGQLELKYSAQGTLQIPPLDLGEDFHSLDRVTWYGELPIGTSVTLRFRASPTNVNQSYFVDIGNGSKPVHQGRFVQWNATLHASSDRLTTPALDSIVLEYTVNKRPWARAGEDRQAYKRTLVALNGTAGDWDGDPLTYEWSRVSGPPVSLNSTSSPTVSFTPTATGSYVFSLVASDGYSGSDPATVTVTVPNRPPRCDAGPNQTGLKRELVTFRSTAEDDDGDPLTYSWEQLAGPPVAPAVRDQPFLSFVPEFLGCYTFRLVVSDGEEESAPSYATALIEGRPPRAALEARPAQAGLNSEILFSASKSSDEDGEVVLWSFDFGDGNATGWVRQPTVNHSYSAPGAYSATVRVRDDDGMESLCATARVTIENMPPVADAQVYPLTGNTSTVFRFSVPGGSTLDPDGTIVSYEWDFGDGTGASGSAQTHVYKKKGTYTIVFTVTDNFGATATVELEVRVLNRPPVVVSSSPAEKSTCYTGVGQLFTVALTDPDGDELSYEWRVDDALQPDNDSSLALTPMKKGTYKVVVRASDGEDEVLYAWTLEVRPRPAPKEKVTVDPFWTAILILVAVAAAVALVVLRRGGGGEEEPPEAVPLESYEGPPPPEAERLQPLPGESPVERGGYRPAPPPPAAPVERYSYAPDPYQQKLWSRRGPY
ncbi:MAG: PKD domain-containing protein [Thermoplasmatota archaeon]